VAVVRLRNGCGRRRGHGEGILIDAQDHRLRWPVPARGLLLDGGFTVAGAVDAMAQAAARARGEDKGIIVVADDANAFVELVEGLDGGVVP
jgi:hypothetical protein